MRAFIVATRSSSLHLQSLSGSINLSGTTDSLVFTKRSGFCTEVSVAIVLLGLAGGSLGIGASVETGDVSLTGAEVSLTEAAVSTVTPICSGVPVTAELEPADFGFLDV